MNTTRALGHATFSQLGNDLFWSFFVPGIGTIRWGGYGDAYWWQNIAHSEQFTTQKKEGRTFVLDVKTGFVEEEMIERC